MRLHRFFISTSISGKEFDIVDHDLVHQWKRVFRYNVGSQVIVFDGTGPEHLAVITRMGAYGATLSILNTKELPSRQRNVWLCVSLIKKDNFELIVQKATEIGVSHILPILSEHSEKKKVNQDRFNKIATEASEQSGRGDIPEIHSATTLTQLFESGILPQEKIVFHPEGSLFSKYNASMPSVTTPTVALFVGPEGGWSNKEIDFFKTYNTSIVSLGEQILRAETAAIVATSLFLIGN